MQGWCEVVRGGDPETDGTPLPSCSVDVRIGVTQAPRELSFEVEEDTQQEVIAAIEAALSGATDVLWLTDKKGRRIAVASARLAYVEIGAPDGGRRIGFGG